jgi:hypothetical protein
VTTVLTGRALKMRAVQPLYPSGQLQLFFRIKPHKGLVNLFLTSPSTQVVETGVADEEGIGRDAFAGSVWSTFVHNP